MSFEQVSYNIHVCLHIDNIYSSLFEFAILLFRVFEEIVQGGTPFEKGIQVDPRIGRKGSLCDIFSCKSIFVAVSCDVIWC